jgi:Conserved hypothetical protein 698
VPKFSPAGKRSVTAFHSLRALLPGIVLCTLITSVSIGLQHLEKRTFEHPYIEALVIAILLGMAVRTAWNPSERWRAGIAFSAKQLLEIAVMLLGASISFTAIAACLHCKAAGKLPANLARPLRPDRGDVLGRRHRPRGLARAQWSCFGLAAIFKAKVRVRAG